MQSKTKNPVAISMTMVALAAVFVTACDVHKISEPGMLASITVVPNTMIPAATIHQMLAIGRDADGRIVPIAPTWTVTGGGGSISDAGMFTAGTVPGTFAQTVVARVGTISGSASIAVTPGLLSSIEIAPGSIDLAAASTQRFVAIGRDTWGNVVAFTPTWSVVAGGGSINQDGTFTAGTVAGNYANTVQASREGIRGFTTVTVTVTILP